MAANDVLPPVLEVTGPVTIPVLNKNGVQIGTETVDPMDFARDGEINRQLLWDAVLMYRANQRAGTHHTLRRGEVAGSTKKLFRQKGTGNARVGTKRTNKRKGGGTAKGPKPRDYEYHLPRKAVQAATRMALLSKFADGEAMIIDDFGVAAPKTKDMAGVLKAIRIGTKTTEAGAEKPKTLLDTTVLISTGGIDAAVYKSARNIEGVEVLPASDLNAYMVLKQKRLLLTKAAFESLKK
jgi:large subunit ribosomal protein L4